MTDHAPPAQRLVNSFINGADQLYAWMRREPLPAAGFARDDAGGLDRLIAGPSRLHSARHRLEIWSANGGRLAWFWMDGDVPHMSNIVACVGIPSISSGLPMFVMNLNLKVKAGTYNTIIGFRGSTERLAPFQAVLAPFRPGRRRAPRPPAAPPPTATGVPVPALAKRSPPGFTGLRLMFWLGPRPIVWSLGAARACLEPWFAGLATAGPAALVRDEQYITDMNILHSRQGGGVYDAVFGAGWLSSLFRDQVFG